MIEHPHSRFALRGLLISVCLALLAGCLPPASKIPDAPVAPTNLTATPGNATVTLAWAASANATGYDVKRATTDGGPYTQLAQLTAPTAEYTDSSVTNGTTYYYVVQTLTTAGSSANSAQVS